MQSEGEGRNFAGTTVIEAALCLGTAEVSETPWEFLGQDLMETPA